MIWLPTKVLEGGRAPKKAHATDAAFDCFVRGDHRILPGETLAVPLGFSIALPVGTAGHVLLRSGHALRGALTMPGGYGLIDPAYTGEVRAILRACGDCDVRLTDGDRVVQLEVVSAPSVTLVHTNALANTARGECGLGSTGET